MRRSRYGRNASINVCLRWRIGLKSVRVPTVRLIAIRSARCAAASTVSTNSSAVSMVSGGISRMSIQI